MNEELENAVAEALRAHDAGAIDVTALRRGSIARARTIRRRRVGLTGAAAVVAIVGAGAAVSAASDPSGTAPSADGGSYGPPHSGAASATLLPLPAGDAPGAAVQPDLVGSDPGTFHFDIDTRSLGADGASFSVDHRVETASLSNGDINNTWYALGHARADLTGSTTLNTELSEAPEHPSIFGRPATLERFAKGLSGPGAAWRITWQPVDGLWAAVSVDNPDSARAVKAAMALKLNISQRCIAPAHLTLPAGYTWTACGISRGPHRPWDCSFLSLSGGAGKDVLVSIGNVSSGEDFVANTTVGSRAAQWIAKPGTTSQLVVPINDWVTLDVGVSSAPGNSPASLTQAEATQLAALIQVNDDFTDSAGWAARPVN